MCVADFPKVSKEPFDEDQSRGVCACAFGNCSRSNHSAAITGATCGLSARRYTTARNRTSGWTTGSTSPTAEKRDQGSSRVQRVCQRGAAEGSRRPDQRLGSFPDAVSQQRRQGGRVGGTDGRLSEGQ